MPVKMTQVQLHRLARGKDLQCFLLPAAYVLIAGITGGYIAGTLVAY